MTRYTYRVLWIFVFLGFATMVGAQAPSRLPADLVLPSSYLQPPASGILDPGGFFSRSPEIVQRLSKKIQKLNQDHGYKIFLVVEPVIIASSAPELAASLRQAWLPDGNGIVVVFESDSKKLGVGRDLTTSPVEGSDMSRLTSIQTNSILERAVAGVDSKLDHVLFLERLIGGLIEGVEDHYVRVDAPPPAGRSVRLALLIAGGIAVLGLVAIGLGSFVRNSSMARVPYFRFPTVDRPERLGAPCGSCVTARRFAPPNRLGR